jgi:hypothetical protein
MLFSQGLLLDECLWLAGLRQTSGQEQCSLFPQKQIPVKAAVSYFDEQRRLCRIP